MLCFLLLLVSIATAISGLIRATTTTIPPSLTRTTWYTKCGYYRYNVSRASFAKVDKWRPIVAFFFVTDGFLDGAVQGINGFLERYASCGLSK